MKKELLFSMKQTNQKNEKNSGWEKIKENMKKCGKIKINKDRRKRKNEKELLSHNKQ